MYSRRDSQACGHLPSAAGTLVPCIGRIATTRAIGQHPGPALDWPAPAVGLSQIPESPRWCSLRDHAVVDDLPPQPVVPVLVLAVAVAGHDENQLPLGVDAEHGTRGGAVAERIASSVQPEAERPFGA